VALNTTVFICSAVTLVNTQSNTCRPHSLIQLSVGDYLSLLLLLLIMLVKEESHKSTCGVTKLTVLVNEAIYLAQFCFFR